MKKGRAPLTHSLSFRRQAMRATGRASSPIAQCLGVELKIGDGAAESVAVHAQLARSLALIPVAVLQNCENELLSEFADRFGIRDTTPVHVHNQGFQLIFHDASLR